MMPKSPKIDIDRLRFKRGDSVILSGTHPLKDRVGEGQAGCMKRTTEANFDPTQLKEPSQESRSQLLFSPSVGGMFLYV